MNLSYEDLMKLTSVYDQDLEEALKWFRESSENDKIRVWSRIVKIQTDPVNALVRRFAQLGFAMIAVKNAKGQKT